MVQQRLQERHAQTNNAALARRFRRLALGFAGPPAPPRVARAWAALAAELRLICASRRNVAMTPQPVGTKPCLNISGIIIAHAWPHRHQRCAQQEGSSLYAAPAVLVHLRGMATPWGEGGRGRAARKGYGMRGTVWE